MSLLAVALAVVALVPPVSDGARAHDWVEALQYVLFLLAVPILFVSGAPWRRIGLSRGTRSLAEARRRHPETWRAVAVVALCLAVAVAWRTPGAVDWLHAGSWRAALEALTLIVGGTFLWLECAGSPPLVPRSTRPFRIALAATAMWTIWVLAYLVAMSHNGWYPAYHHQAGRGLSQAADQQLTAAVLWAAAAVAFVPLVFWNLVQWLRSEEDPDAELHRLVREERRRGAHLPRNRL